MMKTLGLIGGVSWVSTGEYYRRVNELVHARLGQHHSAKILLYSLDFQDILPYQQHNQTRQELLLLSEIAKKLENAGAELLLICSNTTNKTVELLQDELRIPLISIIEATATRVARTHMKTVGLLGTKYVMSGNFYKESLQQKALHVKVPTEEQQTEVNRIIYDELCRNVFTAPSKRYLIDLIRQLSAEGAEGVILGCTELAMCISQYDTETPVFDSLQIHIEEALQLMLK
jgi:aspartate racemase